MVLPIAIAGAIAGRFLLTKGLPRLLSIGKSLIPKTTKGKIIGGLITAPSLAAVVTDPFAVKTLAKVPKKVFKKTKKLIRVLEDPSKAEDILGVSKEATLGKKVLTGLTGAGLLGGAIIGGKALLEKRKRKKELEAQLVPTPALKQLGFTAPRPVGIGGVPVSEPLRPQITPAGLPKQPLGKLPTNIIQISI